MEESTQTLSKEEHAARKVLGTELTRLGGIVFARYYASLHEEAKKQVEAMEFMGRLFEGKLKTEEKNFLEPYLKPMQEVNWAMQIIEKALSDSHK